MLFRVKASAIVASHQITATGGNNQQQMLRRDPAAMVARSPERPPKDALPLGKKIALEECDASERERKRQFFK